MYNMRNKHYGFIILAPSHNHGLIQSTMYSIKRECKVKIPCLCVVGDDAQSSVIENIETMCPVAQGGKTITSLMNTGLTNPPADWNVIIFEGSQIEARSINKLFYFARNHKDILYPIVIDYDRDGRPVNIFYEFHKGTLNGLTIHKDTFNQVGRFSDNPIAISKMFWQMDAIEMGCDFRAVLGAKMI
jgi:hypothetical protein